MVDWMVTKLCDVAKSVRGITCDQNGNMFFTSESGLWKFDSHQHKLECLEERKYCGMQGIIWCDDNKLFICEQEDDVILQYDLLRMKLSIFAGIGVRGFQDGTLVSAIFFSPTQITKDKKGDLYLSDYQHIRKIFVKEGRVTTLAGHDTGYFPSYFDGSAKTAEFSFPSGMVVLDDLSILVCDSNNCCIRKIQNGEVSTVAGNRKVDSIDGTLEECSMMFPSPVLLLRDETLLIADHKAMRRVDFKNNYVSTIEHPEVKGPRCFTMDHNGGIFVGTNDCLLKLEDAWKRDRLLWIGNMKRGDSNCQLALLPKELVRLILSYLHFGKHANK